MKKALLMVVIVILTSCHLKSRTRSETENIPVTINYELYEKQQKGSLLILSKLSEETPKNPNSLLELIIIDTENQNNIIFNNKLMSGTIEWVDENTMKVNYTPGNPEKGKKYAYYFNINNKSYTNTPINQQ